jgi:hypothetical protein
MTDEAWEYYWACQRARHCDRCKAESWPIIVAFEHKNDWRPSGPFSDFTESDLEQAREAGFL